MSRTTSDSQQGVEDEPVLVQSIDSDNHVATLTNESTQSTRLLPSKKSSKKRSRKTGPAADIPANPIARAALILHSATSYMVFQDFTFGTHHGIGGRPRRYPAALWSVLYVLQNAIATQVALETYANLYYNFDVIRRLIRQLLPELDAPERHIATQWLENPDIPSASHISRQFQSLERRGFNMFEAVMAQGIEVAIQDGRYQDSLSNYAAINAIAGDGTVLKAASDCADPFTCDPETGEITARRVDTMALQHHEGGSKDRTVYGTKLVMVTSKGCERHGHIFIGATWVHSPAPAVEADAGVDLMIKALGELEGHGATFTNAVYDRAVNASHQRRLNEIGAVLNTRAMADQPDQSDSHYREPKTIGRILAPCGQVAHFSSIMKRLHQQVLTFDGTFEHLPLKHHNTVQRRGNRNYHYTRFTYHCVCAPDATHEGSIAWNGWRAAQRQARNRIHFVNEEQYMNLLRYLQPVPPGTPEFDELYGIRNITETTHSILDDLLPFKRLQRWGIASKSAFISGFMMGWNIVFTALRNHDLLVTLRLRKPKHQT